MGQVGIEQRSKKREKKLDAVAKKSRQLFEQIFPNPTNPPSETHFNVQWQHYTDELGDNFGSFRDYKYAFNKGVNLVKTHQKENKWNVALPAYIVTDKPPKQLRTFEWQKSAWQIHAFYENWFANDCLSTETPDIQSAYRNLMLSFVFHSGYSVKELVLAFEHHLKDNVFMFKQWDPMPLVTLPLDEKQSQSSRFNTNVYNNEVAQTQFHCYLHPITLGLFRIWFRHQKRSQWVLPNDWNERMTILTQNKLNLSSQQFFDAAVYVCEQHDGVELSQALVECQCARTKTYGLPTNNLARLLHPEVVNLNNIQFSSPTSNTITQNSKVPATPAIKRHDLFYIIKHALIDKPSNGKLTPTQLTQRLTKIDDTLQDEELKSERALVRWYIHKLKNCGVNSLRAYHYNVTRKWLYLCQEHQLHTLDPDELELVYQHAIDEHSSNKSRRYFTARLKDLHAFSVNHLQFSAVSFDLWHNDPTQAHTRSGFIDEALFVALLNAIDNAIDLNEADKLCIKTLSIFSFRGGLRLNELRKLRIKDIEPSNIGWTSVRDTHIADNKTASSLRKLPFYSLLLPDELEIAERYYQTKIETEEISSNHPFFSLGAESKIPIVSFQVSMFIGGLLKSLSQLDHFVFHHLRHSALSRLQVMLECRDNKSLPLQIVPYDIKQRHKICALIFGKSLINGYDQIASFAGHESVRMTFSHYFHFTDWIVAQKMLAAQYALTKLQVNKLGLAPMTRLSKQIDNMNVQHAMAYLNQKLKIQPLTATILSGHIPTIDFNVKKREIISILICYKALTLIEQGHQQKEICERLKLKKETLEKWVGNAYYIKSLSYSKGDQHYSRHFTSARAMKILPAQLKSEEEMTQFNRYINQFRSHYKSHSKGMGHAIDYALHNSSTSRSGIYFSSPEELKKFIDICSLFIPKSHWVAVTHFLNRSIVHNEWKLALSGVRTQVERRSSKRSKKSQGAVRLKLINPTCRHPDNDKEVYASPIVHYLFHMVGILISTTNHQEPAMISDAP